MEQLSAHDECHLAVVEQRGWGAGSGRAGVQAAGAEGPGDLGPLRVPAGAAAVVRQL